MKILLTLLLLSSLLANAQNPPQGGPHRLQFVDTRLNFQYILSDVTKTDTVGYEQFIVPEGIKAGEKWIVSFTKITTTTTPVTEKIDGELATYSTNWSLHGPTTAANWHGGTIAFSNVAGSTMTYEFTGKKIEIYAERLSSHGTGTVKINTGAEVPVSFNTAPFGLPVKIYESPNLPSGVHKVVLKVVSGYVLADYFIVHK